MIVPAEWTEFLNENTSFIADVLVWVAARDRDVPTTIETIGIWSGDDHEVINVGGVDRLYYGAQGHLSFPSGIPFQAGTDVIQMLDMLVGPLTPEVAQLLRGYETRFATIEVHGMLRSILGERIGPVCQYWTGEMDKLSFETTGGWEDVDTVARVTISSSARLGSEGLPDMKSDATYQANDDDRIARFMAVGGIIETPWGNE